MSLACRIRAGGCTWHGITGHEPMAGHRCKPGPRWETHTWLPAPGKATSTPTKCSYSGIPRWPFRVALRLGGNYRDAQDLAQEALMAARQNLGWFRDDSSFSAWLSQIVARRTLNKVTRGRGHLRESRPRGGAQIQQHVIANLHDHIGCTPSP